MRCCLRSSRGASSCTTRSVAPASSTGVPSSPATAEVAGRRAQSSSMMINPHKGRSGFERMMRATGYSIEGLKTAYRGESAFRQESFLAMVMLPAAFILGGTWIEVAVLGGSVLLVLIVE